jgi:phosphatidylglycerol lysyltransferase
MKSDKLLMRLVALIVVGNGLVAIANTLNAQLRIHSGSHISELVVNLPLLSGLTLVYLGAQLNRRKRIAWAVLIPVYSFILGSNLSGLRLDDHVHPLSRWFIGLVLPATVLLVLLLFRNLYSVKSNIQNFRFAVLGIVLTLSVALIYGVSGFLLLDKSDFHQEIPWTSAVHRTIDQFDLTTGHQLVPYTRRASIFLDSLSIISVAALGYAFLSLFQPYRARHSDQTAHRQLMQRLLQEHSSSSEDFFKLWPTDKMYYVASRQDAALAYRVQRGVALMVGEPAGSSATVKRLLTEFSELCTFNDWLPAAIHITGQRRHLYESLGFQLQLIGQEAVVEIDDFVSHTAHNKYFRQISNKFQKAGYSCQWLEPPHSPAVIGQLQTISTQWLDRPGRQERGFMMASFSVKFLQQCQLLAAKDAQGVIKAFLVQLPAFQSHQASYDLLRSSADAPGNINDYLLVNFAEELRRQGFSQLNLGLCPLSGLRDQTDKSLVDSTLRFVYANGNRFYSFEGLYRFKSKYNPHWQPRYIAYKGGVRGFSRLALALNKAMSHLV